ncbi:MAG: hypothetical protein EON54_27740, partial [Alcaligenaceae bacterium]
MESDDGVAVEVEQRASLQGQLTAVIRFDSLRDDWVKGADVLVRLIARSAISEVVLHGFPRQWLPMFIHFGVKFIDPSAPRSYIPIASDLSADELLALSFAARSRDALREMVEAFASLDPLVADVLHRLDRRMEPHQYGSDLRLKLTGWQSYGPPEVLALNRLIGSVAKANHDTAVLLPCARKRPYHASKTHRRIWGKLESCGIGRARVDAIVVSSI